MGLNHVLRRWKTNLITVKDVYFAYDPLCPPAADIVHVIQNPTAIPLAKNEVFNTQIVDLLKADELLLGKMHKTTRYEVRRAEQENISCQIVEPADDGVVAEFAADYTQLRSRKAMGPLNLSAVDRLRRAGQLVATVACTPTGVRLTWHVYVVSGVRARLLYSVTCSGALQFPRSQLSRANRFHHWWDMRLFKRNGVAIYDLGGVYQGNEDAEKVKIAEFKRGFGGADERSYNATVALTLKGSIALEVYAALRPPRGRRRDYST